MLSSSLLARLWHALSFVLAPGPHPIPTVFLTGLVKVSALADWFLYLNQFYTRGLLIALMMEAARTSETLVNFYQTTRHYNPEDSHLQIIFNSQLIFCVETMCSPFLAGLQVIPCGQLLL
jgi:hypothetical protein